MLLPPRPRLDIPSIIESVCPGATVKVFLDNDDILVNYKQKQILLKSCLLGLGKEVYIREALKELVPAPARRLRGT